MAIRPEDIYKRPTIAEQGGVAKYLDLPEQRAKHNGYGYSQWRKWHEPATKLRRSEIAKQFKVSVKTVKNWERLETEEQGNG